MSGIYNHRPMVPGALGGRIPDLLETIKTEFETISQDLNVYRGQKEELEMKSNH